MDLKFKAQLQRKFFADLVVSNLSAYKKFIFYFVMFLKGFCEVTSTICIFQVLSPYFTFLTIFQVNLYLGSSSFILLNFIVSTLFVSLSVLVNFWVKNIIYQKWYFPTHASASKTSGNFFIDNPVFSSAMAYGSHVGKALGEFLSKESIIPHLFDINDGSTLFCYLSSWIIYFLFSIHTLITIASANTSSISLNLTRNPVRSFLLLLVACVVFGFLYLAFRGFKVLSIAISNKVSQISSELMMKGYAGYMMCTNMLFNAKQYWKYDIARHGASQLQEYHESTVGPFTSMMIASFLKVIVTQISNVYYPVLIYSGCAMLAFVHSHTCLRIITVNFCLLLQFVFYTYIPWSCYKRSVYQQQNSISQLESAYSIFYQVSMAIGYKNDISLVIKPDSTLFEPTSEITPQNVTFSCDSLSYSLPNRVLFDNISLNLKQGWYYLLGKNGTGKTTLSNILLGHNTVDSSSKPSFVLKKDNLRLELNNRSLLRDHVLTVDQKPNFRSASILDNLLVYLKPTPEILKQIEFLVNELGLKKDLKDQVDVFNPPFSGGQMKKLQLIRAIITHKFRSYKSLVILDELFAGVDGRSRRVMRKLFKHYFSNTIVVQITHDLEHFKDPDQILFLDNCKLIQMQFKELKTTSGFKSYFDEASGYEFGTEEDDISDIKVSSPSENSMNDTSSISET